MTVLKVKETACAQADVKQQKRKKIMGGGGVGEGKRGGAFRDGELTCRHLFAGSLAESAAALSHRGKLLMPNLPLGWVCAWLGAQWSGCPSHSPLPD